MKDIRPYLIRAMVEWIEDSGNTPHFIVDCAVPGTDMAAEYATDGKLVLNVSANATATCASATKSTWTAASAAGRCTSAFPSAASSPSTPARRRWA